EQHLAIQGKKICSFCNPIDDGQGKEYLWSFVAYAHYEACLARVKPKCVILCLFTLPCISHANCIFRNTAPQHKLPLFSSDCQSYTRILPIILLSLRQFSLKGDILVPILFTSGRNMEYLTEPKILSTRYITAICVAKIFLTIWQWDEQGNQLNLEKRFDKQGAYLFMSIDTNADTSAIHSKNSGNYMLSHNKITEVKNYNFVDFNIQIQAQAAREQHHLTTKISASIKRFLYKLGRFARDRNTRYRLSQDTESENLNYSKRLALGSNQDTATPQYIDASMFLKHNAILCFSFR
ncbi:hypothetical protein ACJX0J_014256, partial [Zea mays]